MLRLWLMLLVVHLSFGKVEIVHKWRTLDFYQTGHGTGDQTYVPEENVFTGMAVWWDRIFLAIPRFRPGVPSTLNYIPRKGPYEESPPLRPYPSLEWQSPGDNCTGFTSVFRVRADACGRLWVLDSGILDSISNFRTVCPPRLYVFDLASDRLIRRVEMPQGVLRAASLLTNLVIDIQGRCESTYVYMTDTTMPGIIVYDLYFDLAWRVQHRYMWPDPDFGTYEVEGESFTLMDGVIGLALSPDHETLYFQPFASDRLFSLSARVLRDRTLALDPDNIQVTILGRKSSQGAPLATDRNGYIYLSPVSDTEVVQWNPRTAVQRTIAKDRTLFQFTLDMEMDTDNGLWMITTRYQKFFRQTLDPTDYNLRIIRITKTNAPYHQHHHQQLSHFGIPSVFNNTFLFP